ncbi:type II secretion system F family protein [Hyphomicrobium sp.]|uniref:type II secretion system F family protein n=1 Tax=Hyphomicrobium sp. TaxID=82 RepID=UPI003F6FE216
MPPFHYQAYTKSGHVESGLIEARSQADATKVLYDRGLLPFRTEAAEAGPRRTSLRLTLTRRLSLSDYGHFARELSVLTNAGLPLDHALRLMTEQASSSQLRDLFQKLLDGVVAGASLSLAFERHATAAPRYIASLIRAGEARGHLGLALADLGSFLHKRADFEARVRSALTYPFVLAVTALVALALMISFLIPAILPLFDDANVEPPLALTIGHVVGIYFSESWPVLLAAIIFVMFVVSRILRGERAQLALDRLLLRIPLIGDILRKINVAILSRTLGTLLRNGVALVPALTMTAAVVPSRPFSLALRAAAVKVREGRRLASIVSHAPELPRLLTRFIAIGEESSKLDEMLLHLAAISDGEVERQFDGLMKVLPALLTIVIGTVVGGLILSVLQALLSVNQLAVQ